MSRKGMLPRGSGQRRRFGAYCTQPMRSADQTSYRGQKAVAEQDKGRGEAGVVCQTMGGGAEERRLKLGEKTICRVRMEGVRSVAPCARQAATQCRHYRSPAAASRSAVTLGGQAALARHRHARPPAVPRTQRAALCRRALRRSVQKHLLALALLLLGDTLAPLPQAGGHVEGHLQRLLRVQPRVAVRVVAAAEVHLSHARAAADALSHVVACRKGGAIVGGVSGA